MMPTYTHEAGKLLAIWMSGKKKEVVEKILTKAEPSRIALLSAAVASTLPGNDVELFLKMLEFTYLAATGDKRAVELGAEIAQESLS